MNDFEDNTAVYAGPMAADDIAFALARAKERAATQNISAFVAVIPNSAFDTITSQLFAMTGKSGWKISAASEKSVQLTYKFTRMVSVVGTQARQVMPCEPMDLAGRSPDFSEPTDLRRIDS